MSKVSNKNQSDVIKTPPPEAQMEEVPENVDDVGMDDMDDDDGKSSPPYFWILTLSLLRLQQANYRRP